MFPICLVVCAVVLLNGASAFFSKARPNFALAINPLNIEARVNASIAGLASGEDSQTEALLVRGMQFNPVDGRFASLAGILLEKNGDRPAAERHYDRALQLQPTEIQALLHKLDYALKRNELSNAAVFAERIGRRWPKIWPEIVPALPRLLADDTVLMSMANGFSGSSALRNRFISSLAENSQTLQHAFKVLMHWHGGGVDDIDLLVNLLANRFLQENDYSAASMLSRLTRNQEQAADGGFVYNGAFRQPFSGNPFDWTAPNTAGVNVSIIVTPPAQADQLEDAMKRDGKSNSLAIRFLDSPVQLRAPGQYLRLAPATYRLEVAYSTERLQMPKNIKLGITCLPKSQTVAEIEFAERDVIANRKQIELKIPATGCGLQLLRFYNGAVAESWKNRYSGRLLIHDVRLSFLGE